MRGQFSYTREQVVALLPLVYDDTSLILASKAEHEERRSKSDPSHGNGLLAAVIDVRRAWAAVEREDYEILACRYVHNLTAEAVAQVFGLESAAEAIEIEEIALDALLSFLNPHDER
jgi:hypothetical protein